MRIDSMSDTGEQFAFACWQRETHGCWAARNAKCPYCIYTWRGMQRKAKLRKAKLRTLA